MAELFGVMSLSGALAGLWPQPRVCPTFYVAMDDQPSVERLMSIKKTGEYIKSQ